MPSWIEDVRSLAKPDVKVLVIGNKCDLTEMREVTEAEAQSFADSLEVNYFETSAKSGERVSEIFAELGSRILDQQRNRAANASLDKFTPLPSQPVNGFSCCNLL